MQFFYNPEGIGDVLCVSLEEALPHEVSSKRVGNVAVIRLQQNGNPVGFNIFEASQYFQLEQKGNIPVTSQLLDKINALIHEAGIKWTLEEENQHFFVIGHVLQCEQHPDSDHLHVCQVDVGEEEAQQIVCGAPNVEQDQYVAVALVGAVMPDGMKIKKAKLRGVPSHGMICSARELGIADAPQERGIMVLSEPIQPGTPFSVKEGIFQLND